jgi:hypothetical protein
MSLVRPFLGISVNLLSSVLSERTRRVRFFSFLTRKLLFEIFSPVAIVLIWNELTHWETDFCGFLRYNTLHSSGF